MDTCIRSNFKWYLYHLTGNNLKTLAAWTGTLETTGRLTIAGQRLKDTQANFWSAQADTTATLEMIQRHHSQYGYNNYLLL